MRLDVFDRIHDHIDQSDELNKYIYCSRCGKAIKSHKLNDIWLCESCFRIESTLTTHPQTHEINPSTVLPEQQESRSIATPIQIDRTCKRCLRKFTYISNNNRVCRECSYLHFCQVCDVFLASYDEIINSTCISCFLPDKSMDIDKNTEFFAISISVIRFKIDDKFAWCAKLSYHEYRKFMPEQISLYEDPDEAVLHGSISSFKALRKKCKIKLDLQSRSVIGGFQGLIKLQIVTVHGVRMALQSDP